MSIANKNLEVHRQPKVTRLDQGRLRVERWLRIKDRKHGLKASLTLELFGGFDLLDGEVADSALAHEKYAGYAFTNCRLVAENTDEVFIQGGQSFRVLHQTYETLTSHWALEISDKAGSTESGLRTLTRVELARPGTSLPYGEDDVGVATVDTPLYAHSFPNAAINRSYPVVGSYDGKSAYSESESGGSPSGVSIIWNSSDGSWMVLSDTGFLLYKCSDDVATPDLCGQWLDVNNGDAPVEGAVVAGKTLTLAHVGDDSDDRRARCLTRWMEPGVLSRTEDKVGSQNAVVIEAFIEVPAEGGHTLAKEVESNYEGAVTRRYTFLKSNTILSREKDLVGSQQAETIQVFDPAADPTPANGGIKGRTRESDVDGVPTTAYTFLKPSVLRSSTSYRNNGMLEIRTEQAFNQTPGTPLGFVLVGSAEGDVDGVPTRNYEFAKGDGEIRRVTRKGEAGIEYLDITYLTAPGAAQPTPVGAGDILTVGKTEATGHLIWTFSNIDDSAYDGSSLIDSITAQKDGALVVVRSAWNQDPDVVDLSGYYQTSKKTKLTDGGKKTVLGTWVKPPANYTEKQTVNFKAPGWAEIPINELVLTAGVSNPYVATISHTFTTTPATAPTMYKIEAWASFQLNYKYDDADGKERHYFATRELPGYLGNDSWAGSNSSWAGQDTKSGVATISSNPSAMPSGPQNIGFVTPKYLSSITGQTVYRNTTTTITL